MKYALEIHRGLLKFLIGWKVKLQKKTHFIIGHDCALKIERI